MVSNLLRAHIKINIRLIMIKIFKEGKPNDFQTYNKLSKFEEQSIN